MDVDLRQFVPMPPNIAPQSSSSKTGADGPEKGTNDNKKKTQHSRALADSEEEDEDSSDDCNGPFAKKSKSEKMDM